MIQDDAVLPVLVVLPNKSTGVGEEEVVVVAKVEPLRVPLSMIRGQPSGDVLSRLLRMPRLVHKIEAASPHRLPHSGGPAGSVEQLTPEEVEPQLPMRHHP